MAKFSSIQELDRFREQLVHARKPERKLISVCAGTACKAYGSDELRKNLKEALDAAGVDDVEVTQVKGTGCRGFCERGILVTVFPDNIQYQQVRPKHAKDIVEKTVKNGEVIEDLLYADLETGERVKTHDDIPFYKKQKQVLMGNNPMIDPTEIDDYIALGGYGALTKVLAEGKPDAVIDTIIKSGLRGRGGGGFPAGVKWKSCREAPGEKKYVICNADEGDPGAFMDRSLLEGNPHSVIEGMIIGSFAIGSDEGYVYVRNEYPLAVYNLTIALQQAEEYGLLGDDILGSGHSFRIHINRGGGAFVCGESTALMASIEGFVGEPRAKHIHTVVAGLYDKPTNLNNVETWANVPVIINKGLDWYTSIGTGDVSKDPWGGSKGTKIFSLVGKVNNTGLVEVPMGITLREIIFEIGGGIKNGKKFKAVQTGGPSGGCLPESKLDLPVDFDQLTSAGSMMGSGGMIVMDEDNCMVDVAKYFLDFLRHESCGKCVTCREGLDQMYRIVDRITKGEGKEGDIELLEELGETVAEASLCALGQTAPNPVLSTIRYFRDEYEAHIRNKACPAHQCQPLIRYVINDNCNGCHVCFKRCPQQCITGEVKGMHEIIQEDCIKCGICYESCKFDAIDIVTGNEKPRIASLQSDQPQA